MKTLILLAAAVSSLVLSPSILFAQSNTVTRPQATPIRSRSNSSLTSATTSTSTSNTIGNSAGVSNVGSSAGVSNVGNLGDTAAALAATAATLNSKAFSPSGITPTPSPTLNPVTDVPVNLPLEGNNVVNNTVNNTTSTSSSDGDVLPLTASPTP